MGPLAYPCNPAGSGLLAQRGTLREESWALLRIFLFSFPVCSFLSLSLTLSADSLSLSLSLRLTLSAASLSLSLSLSLSFFTSHSICRLSLSLSFFTRVHCFYSSLEASKKAPQALQPPKPYSTTVNFSLPVFLWYFP